MSGRRGQLLLIGGLGIAMTLVVLAVVLNTVIFTQNLATREAVDSRGPIEFTNAADGGIGGAVSEANYWNTSSYADLDAEVAKAVSTWAGNATRFGASKGLVTYVELRSTTHGSRLFQSEARAWTNDTGETAWTMADNVSGTRRFHANLSQADLAQTDSTDLGASSAFRINVTDGSGNWSLYVYEPTTGGLNSVNVTAVTPGGSMSTCQATDAYANVDITEATLDGSDCGFTFAEGVPAPYQISVENGANAVGRYSVIVDQEQADFSTSLNASYNDTVSENPRAVPAIYSVDLHVETERADVEYARNLTVAPKDPVVAERYNVSA